MYTKCIYLLSYQFDNSIYLYRRRCIKKYNIHIQADFAKIDNKN